jgi:hypothetical protein
MMSDFFVSDHVQELPVVSIDLTLEDVIRTKVGLILTDDQIVPFLNERNLFCWQASVKLRSEEI